MVALASSPLRLIVRPEIGGSIARFDWVGGEQPVPLFRPWDGRSDDPNRHACYPLVPWSNRISGGGIEAGDRFWPLRPNWPGEPPEASEWAARHHASPRRRLTTGWSRLAM